MRPFKPPTLRKPVPVFDSSSETATPTQPPTKRRKLSAEEDPATKPVVNVPRQALKPITNPPSPETTDAAPIASHCTVLWRNPTLKKNKTWTGDGVLSVSGGIATLYDSSGRSLGRCAVSSPLLPGLNLTISGKEVEVVSLIDRQQFLATVLPKPKPGSKPISTPASRQGQNDLKVPKLKAEKKTAALHGTTTVAGNSIKSAYKIPVKTGLDQRQNANDVPMPRYDPAAQGALVFPRPKEAPPGGQIVDVVLDPSLGKRLHAHQKEGVQFMYESVCGLRDPGQLGCILADDMGLGKTVQTIALLWTLIKQNPIYRQAPVVKKALIVCPVSVIQNWKREFRKWLPHTNLGVLVFEDPKTTRLKMFDGRVYNIMIIGYERLRTVADELAESHDIDIVVCDEGHRLKTEKNKAAKAIQALNTARRIILSGTPIQNDLTEFFCMVNFVNDGCLGSSKAFVRDFETPIMKSRQPHATADAIEKGEAAAEELARTTSPFILRRTSDILSNILPRKTEFVLFCNPTIEQARLYQSIVNSPMFTSALGLSGTTDSALQLITILKKLCNSPALLKAKSASSDEAGVSKSLVLLNGALEPDLLRLYRNDLSAKIRLLDVLLQEIRQTTDEKVVLISSYTSTLNLLANLLSNSGLRYLQLDGSTSASKRQALVDQFNRSPASQAFAFLLSAKAGGVGINLVGASRVVLFDVDWNPATEDQAVARLHRQGQKRATVVYRFLVKGTIEERIWQRQMVKRGLADSILVADNNGDSNPGTSNSNSMTTTGSSKKSKGTATAAFSLEELKDLFRYDDSPGLRTHDLIRCKCNYSGAEVGSDSRSDLSSGSGSESDSDAGSDAEGTTLRAPQVKDIIPASHLSRDDSNACDAISARQSSAASTKKKQEMKEELDCEELLQYSHIDTRRVSTLNDGDAHERAKLDEVQGQIGDPCLAHLVRQDEDAVASSVAFVFKRVWGGSSSTTPAARAGAGADAESKDGN